MLRDVDDEVVVELVLVELVVVVLANVSVVNVPARIAALKAKLIKFI